MTTLLGSWGHRVVTAGSAAEAVERLATCPDQPDLIISDFRLRDGENGIAAIELLRSEYNEAIPAMLITGDTAPDRLSEAQATTMARRGESYQPGCITGAARTSHHRQDHEHADVRP